MPLSVIGAGFGRTGTLSLKLALEQLGFGPCYHMVEVMKNPKAPGYWEGRADGNGVDWEVLFEGYRSTVDWPSTAFYEELAAAYPQAKVILTERDSESWFKSTQATIFARDFPTQTDDPWLRMIAKTVLKSVNYDVRDKAKLIATYEAHNARVRQVIPAERLLVYNAADGWEPLCKFLGVAVPDGPSPKVNSTEEFQKNIAHEISDRVDNG